MERKKEKRRGKLKKIKRNLLNRFYVIHCVVGHVSLPRSGSPGARFRGCVYRYFATVRAEVSVVSRIFWGRDCRCHADWQAEEAFHVDHLRPGYLTTIMRETSQRALVSRVNVRVVANFRFLAKSAHVRIGFLWKIERKRGQSRNEYTVTAKSIHSCINYRFI